jgi:hypothetical protein
MEETKANVTSARALSIVMIPFLSNGSEYKVYSRRLTLDQA